MRFIGTVLAWLAASLLTYVLAVAASQQVILAGVDAFKEVPLMVNLRSTLDALTAAPMVYSYSVVILIGLGVAFFVAALVKAMIPILAPIAYPTAGGAAMATSLWLMEQRFDVVTIPGAQDIYGFWLQIGAGVIGGIAFELMRPKAPDERD